MEIAKLIKDNITIHNNNNNNFNNKKITSNNGDKNNPYNQIAKGMEIEFLKYLLKEMRSTVDKNEEDSEEVSFYTQLLDQEYAKALADKNQGVGIQNMILKQLLPKYQNRIASMDAYKNIQKTDTNIINNPSDVKNEVKIRTDY